MPIEFYCPGCGNLMRTPDDTAGRKGRCPTCRLKIQIPAGSLASASPQSAVRPATVAAPVPPDPPSMIRFECGGCGKALGVTVTKAGKMGQCPHCGRRMAIPVPRPPAANPRWRGAPKPQEGPP